MEGERIILTKSKSPLYKETRGSFLIRIFFASFLVLLVLGGALIALMRNPKFLFQEVHVIGTATFPAEKITEFTHQYWEGNYFGVVPKSSTLLFSKNHFQKKLMRAFPVIDMAYITLPSPDMLQINIKEREPKIVWCFSDTACGFVDKQGILYAPAPNFSDGVYPIFQSQSDGILEDKLGTEIIHPDTMDRFIILFHSLQSDTMTLSKTYFYDDGDIALSIDTLFGVYTKNAAKLLATVGQDDAIFIRDLKTGLNNDAFKKQFTSNPKTLEYIDMRFKGKIFYKFTTSEKPIEKAAEPNSD